MRKKILCGALLTAMCLSMAACGDNKSATTTSEVSTQAIADTTENNSTEVNIAESEAVTADSLIKRVEELIKSHPDDTMNMTINVNMSMTGSAPTESGETKELNIPFTMNGKCQFSDSVSYIETTIDIDLGEEMGGKQTNVSKIYGVKDGETLTSYMSSDGQTWTKTSEPNGMSSNFLNSINDSIFTDKNLEETDTEYIVTGKVDATKLNELAGLAGTKSDANATIKLFFDKDKEFTKMTIDFGQMTSNMGLAVDTCEFEIINDGFVMGKIEVPQEIIDNATVSTIIPTTDTTAEPTVDNTSVEGSSVEEGTTTE